MNPTSARLAGASGPGVRARLDAFASWRLAALAAGILGLIGWVTVVTLWFPLNLASPEWEFGTISASFDSLPVATLALVVFAAAASALGWRRRLRAASVLAWLIALVLVGVFALYGLNAIVALSAAPDELRRVLMLAIFKTSLFALIYTVVYLWLGVSSWRGSRRPR